MDSRFLQFPGTYMRGGDENPKVSGRTGVLECIVDGTLVVCVIVVVVGCVVDGTLVVSVIVVAVGCVVDGTLVVRGSVVVVADVVVKALVVSGCMDTSGGTFSIQLAELVLVK
ncbi:Uncharacterized protein Rs2_04856 [Raphanus sativus]|nr:Uncharacterized protein Rs2_04856 [Raphanus sativus]